MKYNGFYKFDTRFVKSPITVKNDNLTFEQANMLSRGDYKSFQFPINFNVISGKKWLPVLNPPSVGLYILKKDIVENLEAHQIKGFASFEVLIVDQNGEVNNDYCGFSIIGKSGKIEFTKSQIIEKKTGEGYSKYYRGLFPNMDTWDHSDIFRPVDSLFVIMSEKAKKIFDKYEKTNLDFVTLNDVELMSIIVDSV